MTLHGRLIAYIAFLHILFAVLLLVTLQTHIWWFFALEAAFLVSLWVGVKLVQATQAPLYFLRSGLDQINDGEFATRFQKTGSRELDALIDVYNEMVNSLRDERLRLGEQRDFLEKLLVASPAAVLVMDFDGLISAMNPSAEDLLECPIEDAKGRSLKQLPSPLAGALCELELDQPKFMNVHGRRRIRGVRSSFSDRGFRREFMMIEELTDELRARDRAAYDKLLRIMAHEINNTVGATNSLLESCLDYGTSLATQDQADLKISIETIMTRHDHLNRVMRDFAAVVKVPEPRCQPTNLPTLLSDVERLVSAACQRRRIACRWSVPDSVPTVFLDRHLMEQALLNITKNAIEAIDEDGYLEFRIEVHGELVRLAIVDSGGALTDDIKRELFSPFFSTKASGRGVGLTLIQEILNLHGFDFALDGVEGEFTAFTIWMPRAVATQALEPDR